MKFVVHPNSANLYDRLAEAYLFLGKKEKAIENFEKSLELDLGLIISSPTFAPMIRFR